MKRKTNSEAARAYMWSYTFDEILEIIQILHWTESPSNQKAGQSPSSSETVISAYGERTVKQGIRHHMQQQLCVKVGAIYGKSGEGYGEKDKEVAKNSKLQRDWFPEMNAHAEKYGFDVMGTVALIDKLIHVRNKLIAHRDGAEADVHHENGPEGRSVTFRADPAPLTTNELESLSSYIKASKQFADHAKISEAGPVFPYDFRPAKSGEKSVFQIEPFTDFIYEPKSGWSVSIHD